MILDYVTGIKKAASNRKRLRFFTNKPNTLVLPSPYAGITQIRFKGCNLRLLKPPHAEKMLLFKNIVYPVICQAQITHSHGNVKVDSNLVKSGGFALPITGLKSEIPGPDRKHHNSVHWYILPSIRFCWLVPSQVAPGRAEYPPAIALYA